MWNHLEAKRGNVQLTLAALCNQKWGPTCSLPTTTAPQRPPPPRLRRHHSVEFISDMAGFDSQNFVLVKSALLDPTAFSPLRCQGDDLSAEDAMPHWDTAARMLTPLDAALARETYLHALDAATITAHAAPAAPGAPTTQGTTPALTGSGRDRTSLSMPIGTGDG